jgi:hypothetical protein
MKSNQVKQVVTKFTRLTILFFGALLIATFSACMAVVIYVQWQRYVNSTILFEGDLDIMGVVVCTSVFAITFLVSLLYSMSWLLKIAPARGGQ